MSTLYIVGTPIGNLEDISMRALRILGEVDFVLCEDTRVTQILLNHYNIKTPTISYHEHSDENKIRRIVGLLAGDKNLALVCDAGTPGISDPGGKLIQAVLEKLNGAVGIESVPGPSAVTAALSISGILTDKFIFMGFPPHKKGRQTFIKKIIASEYPVVIYESKHRIIKFLEELEQTDKSASDQDEQKPETASKKNITSVVVCREMSKMHETVYRGDIKNIIKKIRDNKDEQRGEFVVIIGK